MVLNIFQDNALSPDGRNHFAEMCSQDSRKIHTVVPLPCPDFELFVGDQSCRLIPNNKKQSQTLMVLPLIAQGMVLNIFQDNALSPDGRNHFAEMCSQDSRKIHTVVPLPCPDFELFVGELEVDLLDTEAWYRKMEVAGDIVNFTLDTGAETYLNLNMVLSATSKRDIKRTLKH